MNTLSAYFARVASGDGDGSRFGNREHLTLHGYHQYSAPNTTRLSPVQRT